jgi:hypothetical protein
MFLQDSRCAGECRYVASGFMEPTRPRVASGPRAGRLQSNVLQNNATPQLRFSQR